MAGKRGKTEAGKAAESRKFEFSRFEEYATRADGQMRTRRLYWVRCIKCHNGFETPGGNSEGKHPKDFAYRLNWRCENCRDPKSVEIGRRRFEGMQRARNLKKWGGVPTAKAPAPKPKRQLTLATQLTLKAVRLGVVDLV